MSNLITNFFKNNQVSEASPVPIWLMRQAGRYLPEYLTIRNQYDNFLDFCYTPEAVVEVTLQPIKRYDFDAAIIFSDILVIPDLLGIRVEFQKNHGPVLEQVSDLSQLKTKLNSNTTKTLDNVYQAIKKTREKLPKNKSLIGFAGSPWTLACYMVEGKLTKDLSIIKKLYYNDPNFILYLLDLLAEQIAQHLVKQISHGADIIKLFDSWAGLVSTNDDYQKLIINPTQKIIALVKKAYPNIPIMCFPRLSGINYQKFCDQVDCNIITIDSFMDLNWIKSRANGKIIQGNLDPVVLLTKSHELIKKKIEIIFQAIEKKQLVFNLGHGVLPSTPTENVEYLVKLVREY